MPGLWKHDTRHIQFTLVVDNFGVKYTQKEDVTHLQNVIEQNYTVTADWTGNQYIGIRVLCQIALTVLKPLLMDPSQDWVIQ